MLRILIDINIIIHREESPILDDRIAELFKIMNKHLIKCCVHDVSVQEIQKNPNKTIREQTLSKIKAYPPLEYLDPYQESSQENCKDYLDCIDEGRKASSHDKYDNILLYPAYHGAVFLFITEDKKLLKKAHRLNLQNVHSVDSALECLQKLFPDDDVSLPLPKGIKDMPMAEIDISDPLFDSLKQSYENFEDWFKKKAEEGRRCYVSYFPQQNNLNSERLRLGGFMYLKIEEGEKLECKPSPHPPLRRLKIGTLKVSNTGLRIGEAYINIALHYAHVNGINEIYLTHFEEPDDGLVKLIKTHGFDYLGFNDVKYAGKSENYYIKRIKPEKNHICNNPYEDDIKYYPSIYDGAKVKKYIIPIKPEYHDRLFLNGKRQTMLDEYSGEHIIEGYAILKAYLSNSPISKIKPGDIVIFYKTKKEGFTEVGVVDQVERQGDPDKICGMMSKRTVYTYEEIREMTSTPPYIVILFRDNFQIKKNLKLEELCQNGILQGPPQSIMELSEDKYLKLKSLGVIDESFTFN